MNTSYKHLNIDEREKIMVLLSLGKSIGMIAKQLGRAKSTINHEEKRGKIAITHHLKDRPQIANERLRIGDWEADTVLGKSGNTCQSSNHPCFSQSTCVYHYTR